MFRCFNILTRVSQFSGYFRHYSIKDRTFQEVKIPVQWGHIAGKWWNPSGKRPILAIHGWQDNCGVFDRLIPTLPDDVGILAIDLPGHGHSSWLPHGMYYHHMNYPILIQHISSYFKWPQVSLMGHSLGGISCFVYTMIFPETVDFVICLDGVKPLHMKNNAPRLAKGIQDMWKYDELGSSNEEPPSYDLETMKKKVSSMNNNSIALEHCHHILNRNIAKSKTNPGKYYFTRDPRLKARVFLNWAQKDILEGAYRVTCPILMVKFEESGYFEERENFYEVLDGIKKTSRDAQYHYVPGSHHTLLNNPAACNTLINDFIKKHNTKNRDIGGIIKDIIV